jgi:hypothetical protein
VQVVGFTANSTLWALPPDGYENVTVSPALMVTVSSPEVGFTNEKSRALMTPGARSEAPCASAGIAIAAMVIATHGSCRNE